MSGETLSALSVASDVLQASVASAAIRSSAVLCPRPTPLYHLYVDGVESVTLLDGTVFMITWFCTGQFFSHEGYNYLLLQRDINAILARLHLQFNGNKCKFMALLRNRLAQLLMQYFWTAFHSSWKNFLVPILINFVAYIRPHHEYACQVQDSYLIKVIIRTFKCWNLSRSLLWGPALSNGPPHEAFLSCCNFYVALLIIVVVIVVVE